LHSAITVAFRHRLDLRGRAHSSAKRPTLIRQDVFLDFMAEVERAGTSFAFPTRTVHLVSDKT
jgi:hypothetical protein